MLDCQHGPVVSTFDHFNGKVQKAHGETRMSGWTTVVYKNRDVEPDAPNVNDVIIQSDKLTQFSSYNMFRQSVAFDPREDAWMEYMANTSPEGDVYLHRIARLPYMYSDIYEKNLWIEQPDQESQEPSVDERLALLDQKRRES